MGDGILGSDRGITVVNQGLLELSTTQKHKLGERLVRDERVYRYAYCEDEQIINMAASTLYPKETGIAGATTVADAGNNTVTMGAIDTTTSVPTDYFAGGYVCYRETRLYFHKIKSHPYALNAATCVLTLETPVVGHDVDTGTTLNVYRSMWNTRGTNTGDGAGFGQSCSWAGLPAGGQVIPVGSYYWCQTWGPCIGSQVDFYGDLENDTERLVCCTASGAFQMKGSGSPAQPIGYFMPDTYTLGTTRAVLGDSNHLVMLQIVP